MPSSPAPSLPRGAPASLLPLCLGFVALGLLWRTATERFAAPSPFGEAMVAASLVAVVGVVSLYMRRLAMRPTRIARDLSLDGGRSPVPAGAEAIMLSGAAVGPVAPYVASLIWALGLSAHVALASRVARTIRASRAADWAPAVFLLAPFGGLVVAPLAIPVLADTGVATGLFWAMMIVYGALTPALVWRLLDGPTRPRLRPGAYVLLAPPSIGVIALESLHPGHAAVPVLFALAVGTLFTALMHRRWLLGDGFAPGWACFTFPTSAFAGACLAMAERHDNLAWRSVAILAVAAATVVTAHVAVRTAANLRRWRRVAA